MSAETPDAPRNIIPYSIVYGTIEAHAQGYFPGMPANEYHAQAAFSASGGKLMLRSMLHYKTEKESRRKSTKAQDLGTVVHAATLEPDRLDDLYCVAPALDLRRTRDKEIYAEFLAANVGRVVLRPGEDERAKRSVEAVLRHPAAARLLAGAETEGSCFWENPKFRIPCKMRFDIRNLGGLADLKTTKDASAEEFGRDCATFHYPLQAAVYVEGYRMVFGVEPLFFCFIAVETTPPYGVAVYECQITDILAGRHYFMEAAARYKRAIAYDDYPCYPDDVQKLRVSRWYNRINAY